MKILAIETATEACSAALKIGDTCRHQYKFAPRQHTELILPMVESLLSEADCQIQQLDCIAFGQGPGAFTGVRIAIGVVQGLALAHDIPVIPISSLAALAQQFAKEHDRVASVFDARMQEIYWGLYQKDSTGLMRLICKEQVSLPENIDIGDKGAWFGAGSGWIRYAKKLQLILNTNLISFQGEVYPSAKEIVQLAVPVYEAGHAIPIEQAAPVYLRNTVT